MSYRSTRAKSMMQGVFGYWVIQILPDSLGIALKVGKQIFALYHKSFHLSKNKVYQV